MGHGKRRPSVSGRVSVLPRLELDALPKRERLAVVAFEAFLWSRGETKHEPFVKTNDGRKDGVFLTDSHMQEWLWKSGSPWRGEKFAAECIRTLKRLRIIEDTGEVKKPKAQPNRAGRTEGGRHAQPSPHRSYWWRVYRVLAVTKLLTPVAGAYKFNRRQGTASLSAFVIRQGLISPRRSPSGFQKGSVQAAFWATGPP